MSDRLHLPVLSKIEHTVESGTHRNTSGVVVCRSECTEHLAFYILYSSCIRIVLLLGLSEEPVHTVGHARSYIDVLHKREVRETDLEVMCHTILELVKQTRLFELAGLEADLVLQRGVVAEGELLIERLLSDSVLLLERIETAH